MGDGSENRKTERHRVRFHLVYDDGSSYNAAAVRDVSEGGLFLETALPLPVGTELRLTPLESEGDHLFEVRARVMRSIPYDPDQVNILAGMGVQFLDLNDAERQKIVSMIRALELRARERAANSELDPFLGVKVPSLPPGPAKK